jgi:hypothetical protein
MAWYPDGGTSNLYPNYAPLVDEASAAAQTQGGAAAGFAEGGARVVAAGSVTNTLGGSPAARAAAALAQSRSLRPNTPRRIAFE